MQNHERVAFNAAERVADVHNLVIAVPDLGNLALAEQVGERVEGCDLQRGLNLVDGLAMLGLADTQTVPCECAVVIVVCCSLDVCTGSGLVARLTV